MKKNTPSEELRAFQSFYKVVFRRLTKKQKAMDKKLGSDENPLLVPVREGLADLNAGGKMLRGMLVVLGFRIARKAAEKKLAAARGGEEPVSDVYADELALAFEIFQTGILVHDDIIDNAELRRGKETIHRRCARRFSQEMSGLPAGEAGHLSRSVALCAGDYALYEAVRRISAGYPSEENLGSLIRYFSEVVLDTIRGELLDVMLPGELKLLPEEEAGALLEKCVEDIYRLKTAKYSVVGPLHLGMLLGEASPRQMRALDVMAEDLGIAYQIKDDILGIFADEKELGKDVGSDISEGKQTILYMYVRNRKPEYLGELLAYYGKPAGVPELEAVQRIFRESGALDFAIEEMEKCFLRAEEKLASFRWMDSDSLRILQGFIGYCRGRKY